MNLCQNHLVYIVSRWTILFLTFLYLRWFIIPTLVLLWLYVPKWRFLKWICFVSIELFVRHCSSPEGMDSGRGKKGWEGERKRFSGDVFILLFHNSFRFSFFTSNQHQTDCTGSYVFDTGFDFNLLRLHPVCRKRGQRLGAVSLL